MIASLKANYKAGKGRFFFKCLPLFRILGLQVSHLIILRGDVGGRDGSASPRKQLVRAPAWHLSGGICCACSLSGRHADTGRFSNALRSLRRP